jgi:glutamyl-tRNA reductase
MRRYFAVGCNHATARPAEIGRAQIPPDLLDELLPSLKDRLAVEEMVYLATCHRTEWYLVYDGAHCPGQLLMTLASALPELTHGAAALPEQDACFAVAGRDAASHLFRVICALDSLMVGDNQILGQVKEAFRRAGACGLSGPLTTVLFTQAFRAAKRVRTETSLSRGAVSLVSLAERQIAARLGADPAPVAIVGAGKTATLAAGLVRSLDAGRRIVVFNRGQERGSALAARFGAEFRPLGALGANGDRYASVIVGASAPQPLIGPALAAHLAPTFLLDLGMPPAVDPACDGVAGIERVDQRALDLVAEANRRARHEEIGRAEAIVDEQLHDLAYEVMEVELSPVAHRLLADFREVLRGEFDRVAGPDRPARTDEIDAAVERLCRRLVRVPLRGLREVAWQHTSEVLSTFLAAVQR